MTLRQDWYQVKDTIRSMNRASIKKHAIPREELKRFRDPRTHAGSATAVHEPLSPCSCRCGRVAEGQTYREHLIEVLNDSRCLRVPPNASGEEW